MTFKVKILKTLSKDQVKNIVDSIKAIDGVLSVSRTYNKKKEDKKKEVPKPGDFVIHRLSR